MTPKLTPGMARITAAFPRAGELEPSTSRALNLRVGPGNTCMVRERERERSRSHHGTNNGNNNNNADASGRRGGGHKRHHHS
jgi:hypothetical protein